MSPLKRHPSSCFLFYTVLVIKFVLKRWNNSVVTYLRIRAVYNTMKTALNQYYARLTPKIYPALWIRELQVVLYRNNKLECCHTRLVECHYWRQRSKRNSVKWSVLCDKLRQTATCMLKGLTVFDKYYQRKIYYNNIANNEREIHCEWQSTHRLFRLETCEHFSLKCVEKNGSLIFSCHCHLSCAMSHKKDSALKCWMVYRFFRDAFKTFSSLFH